MAMCVRSRAQLIFSGIIFPQFLLDVHIESSVLTRVVAQKG